jgi:outer membrane receptor protein involved in Fe transport
VAVFQQNYSNTIEITYGAWDKYVDQFGNTQIKAGFKYLNTGDTRVQGVEISLPGEGKLGKDLKLEVLADYTYIIPQALDPNKVFATDSNYNGVSYANSSTDTKNNILKYRFQTIGKIDFQLTYKKFSFGGDWRYYSVMQNIDTIFYLFDSQAGYGIVNYREKHNSAINVFDGRIGVQATKVLKVAFVVDNIFNLSYSLRPLKIEPPRTFAIRLTFKVD